MIWVTWRQQRLQLLFGVGVLVVLLAFLVPTGFNIWSAFRSTGLAHCLALPGRDCGNFSHLFQSRYNGLAFTIPLFLILPAMIGVFWGAPLVARELEQGTHRLAWTQTVTRTRWAWTKIAMVLVATLAGTTVISWVVSWWSSPLVAASDSRFNFGVFDLRGIVPVAYALFALALGVAAGTVIRRVLPAMGATIAGYVAVRLGVEFGLRPHFAAAKTISYSFFGVYPRSGLGDWIRSTNTVDRAGHILARGEVINTMMLSKHCPTLPRPGALFDPTAVQACVQRVGLHIVSTYQPGNRYWTFQGIESAIFVALAIGLLVFSVWFVRRRIV
jgi:ABC-type transport system involved in multi-copper enzyme maturation permease subunit